MSANRPRVLALSDHLGHSNGRVHGGTTYFVNVYPALARSGVDITVVFMSPPHPAAESLREQNIEPIFLSRPKWDFRAYRDVLNLVDQKNIEILHLASFKSHFVGRLIAKKRGCKSIVHLHDTVPLKPHIKFLQRTVAKHTDLSLSVSSPVAELGVRDYGLSPEISQVLHNAIDIDRFSQPRPDARKKLFDELSLDVETQLVGIIGRLAPMKGHRYLIDAFPQVIERCPHAKLLVCGDGPTRKACEQQVRQLGLKDAVIFAGQRDDIPDVLAALDMLAMPSISGEGLPYAAIEAIAAGKVIVAYPTAGIPEIVLHDQVGLLVDHQQVRPFADAIVRVLSDDTLRERLTQGARQHAQNFTIERHVQKLADIYRSLIADKETSA